MITQVYKQNTPDSKPAAQTALTPISMPSNNKHTKQNATATPASSTYDASPGWFIDRGKKVETPSQEAGDSKCDKSQENGDSKYDRSRENGDSKLSMSGTDKNDTVSRPMTLFIDTLLMTFYSI